MDKRNFLLTLAIIGLLGAALLIGSCTAIPPSLPPVLRAWAAQKAQRLAECTAAGHRGTALVKCMGDFARDRGTYACERLRVTVEGT